MYLIYFWTPTSRQCWYCLEKWHVDHCLRVKGLLIIGYQNNEIFWAIMFFFFFYLKKKWPHVQSIKCYSALLLNQIWFALSFLPFPHFFMYCIFSENLFLGHEKSGVKHLPIKMQNNLYLSFTFYGCDYSICTFLFLLTISPLN